jgi:hypothetical protein
MARRGLSWHGKAGMQDPQGFGLGGLILVRLNHSSPSSTSQPPPNRNAEREGEERGYQMLDHSIAGSSSSCTHGLSQRPSVTGSR